MILFDLNTAIRGIASGWTMSRGPEGPWRPNQNKHIGLGALTDPYLWAPEGLAMPVTRINVNSFHFKANLVLYLKKIILSKFYILYCFIK